MSRDPIPTWYFALVIVRLGRRFLLVRESKHGQSWYLPGGRVMPSESLTDAARRETLEESGVPVDLEGVLRIEHSPSGSGMSRVRVLFVARPRDDVAPKSIPDDHSLAAGWFTLEEMKDMKLRGPEVLSACEHVLRGGAIYPLKMLSNEAAGWD